MLVFCNGMMRSASTWCYNATRALLELCYPGEAIASGYTDKPVEFLRAVAPEAKHVLIKNHHFTPLAYTLARTGAAKVIFTIRDPADAVASGIRSFAVDFERFFGMLKPSLELLAFHRQTGNAVILEYDEIIAAPRHAVRRIGEYLAPERLSEEIVAAVAAQTSFERMRQRLNEIEALAREGKLAGSHDPRTLMHPNHMSDGRSGKGREELTAEQLERIDRVVRECNL